MTMKKFTVILILACMLLSACKTNTPSAGDETTVPPDTTALQPISPIPDETTKTPETSSSPSETTGAPETSSSSAATTGVPEIDFVPEITLWDKDEHPITELLSMSVGEIRSKYGTLALVESDSMADRAVYGTETLKGVLMAFENRDMSLPLDDALIPDSIKLTEEYDGGIAGVSIGSDGRDVMWNDAVCTDAPTTFLIGRNYIITATYMETDETFPDGYPAWSNDKYPVWKEEFCLDPVGKIIGITIEKKNEELPHGELEVTFNADNTSVHDLVIPLRTKNATYEVFDYDDRYVLYVVKNKNISKFVNMDPDTYPIELFVIDTLEGKIVYSEELTKITEGYGYGGCNVVFLHTDTGGELALWESAFDKLTAAYDIAINESVVKLTKKDSAAPLPYRERFTSPDGVYTVFNVRENAADSTGGIDLLMPDGTYKRLLANNPGYEQVETYSAVGFIDDVTLAYSIGGWEHIKGYGTYNIATGENKEFRGDDYLFAADDGYIYVRESKRVDESGLRAVTTLCSISSSGKRTRIASTTLFTLQNGERVYISEVKAGEVDLTSARYFYEGSGWIVLGDTVNFYSADFDKLYVSLEAPSDNTRLYDNVHVYNRVITVVSPRFNS